MSSTGQEFINTFNAVTAVTAQYPSAVVVVAEAQCCVLALTYIAPCDYFDEDDYQENFKVNYYSNDGVASFS